MRREGPISTLGFLLVVVTWGFNYPFLRLGTQFAPPAFLFFLRALAGLLIMIPLLRGIGWQVELTRPQILRALAIGAIGYGAFFLLWGYAAAGVPPGEASVFIYLFPIWVLLLSAPLLRQVPRPLQLAGVLLGFVGVVLVAGVGTRALAGSPRDLLLLTAAGFCWAIGTVLTKRDFRRIEIMAANAWQLAAGTAVLGGVALTTEPWGSIRWTGDLLVVVAWTGILGTGAAYLIWYYLLARNAAGPLSAFTFLVVVVAWVGSIAFFQEAVDPVQVSGVALILIALYLVGRGGTTDGTIPPIRPAKLRSGPGTVQPLPGGTRTQESSLSECSGDDRMMA
ncbi:MAG: DMT family transporter [Thermoplasmata archaeon]